jgi:quercetin dioxygenase-like cupin family protein
VIIIDNFPEFMRNKINKIDTKSQFTDDIEGYLFDGLDGSQMAFWTCKSERISEKHCHDFDEYMIVAQGEVTIYLDKKKHILQKGDEIYIPKGTVMRVQCTAGTRTIHAFEKKRAERMYG